MPESPEAIALELLKLIATAENKQLDAWGECDRQWILQTYAQCRLTVSSPQFVSEHLSDFKIS